MTTLKSFFILCVLMELISTVYAAQLPEFEGSKSSFDDVSTIAFFNDKIHGMFTYDASTLVDQAPSTSIFIDSKDGLFVPSLCNEYFDYPENGKLNSSVKKKEKIHNRQSGFNALNLPESITFYALVKEQSPTNTVDMGGAEKIDPSAIYASKYYPQRMKYTIQGRVLHLEARFELPTVDEHRYEMLQLILFVESSPIIIDQNTWASEIKQTTINGAGIGINWTLEENFAFQAYFSNELEGQVLAISPTLSNLYWIQAVKFF